MRDPMEDRRCDWKDGEDQSFYRREARMVDRVDKIQEVAPLMSCPLCGELKPDPIDWVVLPGRVCCRSCHHRPSGIMVDKITPFILNRSLRYEIDCSALILARESVGLSQREFARIAGWSRSYQRSLEGGRCQSVSQENLDTIIEVFKRFLSKKVGSTLDPP